MKETVELTKSHVKHPVSFIEHKVCNSLEVRGLTLDEVYHSARSAHYDLRTTLVKQLKKWQLI